MHSIFIQGRQLLHAHQRIQYYQGKFSHLLSPKNVLLLKQLLFVTRQLLKFLEKQSGAKESLCCEEEILYDCTKFAVEAGIDHINLDSLVQFCERTKLPLKLANMKMSKPEVSLTKKGLSEFLRPHSSKPEENITEEFESGTESSMLTLVDFLRVLINVNEDGRILSRRSSRSGESFIKYLLLNPASYFGDFITLPRYYATKKTVSCTINYSVLNFRSVVLVGGTMQPTYEFEYQLFGACGAPRDRIMTFSCGHIVSPNHVLPMVLTKGASGKELDFCYSKRSSLLDEIAIMLLNLSKVNLPNIILPTRINIIHYRWFQGESFVFCHPTISKM